MDQKLLVTLDSLLDTRVSTLSLVNQDWATRLLSADYLGRVSDEFQYLVADVDINAYRDRYRSRDIATLMHSIPTQMSFILNGVISIGELEGLSDNPEFDGIELEVNTYPYSELTEEELDELSFAISARAGIYIKPKMVYIPYEKMTFDRIQLEGWTTIILYDFNEWWESIALDVQKAGEHLVGAPGTVMMVPALLRNIEEARDASKRTIPNTKKVLDPFETTQIFFSRLISITFLSPEAFSLVLPESEDVTTTTN